MPNKTYRLYPKAVEDLEAIYFYSIQEFGQRQAEIYIKNLEQTFVKIANNTELTRQCGDILKGLRSINTESHIIFFKQIKNSIAIIRILHKAMDHKTHLHRTK